MRAAGRNCLPGDVVRRADSAHKRFGCAKTLPQGQFTCPEEGKTRGPQQGAQPCRGRHIANEGYRFLDLADIS